MKARHQRALAVAVFLLAAGRAETSELGVVVEEVDRGSVLEGAGVRAGDLFTAWERSPDLPANPQGGAGELRTFFDWVWVKTEQAPRGSVRLHGERSSVAVAFEVPRGLWVTRVRPWMAADHLLTFTEGQRRIESGDLEEGIALWNQLAESLEPQAVPGLRCWILLQVSEAWSKGGQGDKARSSLQTALAAAPDAQTRIVLWEALGESYQYANQMALAESSFRSALEAGEAAWGDSLQVASTITRLGNVMRLRSRLDAAEQLQTRAFDLRQRLAPDSPEVAGSLHELFKVAMERGELEKMSELAGRALAIQEKWPDGSSMADTLDDVAIVAMDRGRYGESAAALQRGLMIRERWSAGSIPMATSLVHLATVARAVADDESAQELLQRALAIRERLAPASLGTASILSHLGALARRRGDLGSAAELFRRSLSIWEKAAPQGLGVAGNLYALGNVARMRGDLDEAQDLFRRALEIGERIAPAGLDVGRALNNLGMVAEARGDLDLALDLQQRAEEIFGRLAPNSIDEALTLQQLGRVYRRTRRLDQAAQLLARAVEALESQVGKLGGSPDLQAMFRAQHEEVYRDAIEVELERGHAAEAFHLVERSRARSFLLLLAERDLELSGDLPASLDQSRRDNAARYDQALRELARWAPAAGEPAKENLERELSGLRREREEIAAEIRKASPRLAALRQPQPLDLAAARKVLDDGTLALSYSVGKEKTVLFAITRARGLRVEVLPVGEERLRRDVARFLERIQSQEAPVDLARSLYRMLIAPVADLVERSERVLILPDGPLHRLPFGALMRDTKRGQYLAAWKPLHSALSLTVYGALRASREPSPAAGSGEIVAFGDPHYPKDVAPSQGSGEPIRRALGLDLRSVQWKSLPYSRREVERIAAAYPKAHLYLGDEAIEEQAKSVGRDARVLHFATHGYLDDRSPLDSALVLTIPADLPAGRDNGLLQVWEIFESVRLDADLVVLSACDSALGRELSGEGLIGLTRAFQYAGARSVVASLWSVADQVTAELMARFHRHYAAGLPKDEALRRAQIELIREPIPITTANGQTVETVASAPFFWAAFQLFGDRR